MTTSPRYPSVKPARAMPSPDSPVFRTECSAQCPQTIPAGRKTSQATIHPHMLKTSEQMASELVFREGGGPNPHC